MRKLSLILLFLALGCTGLEAQTSVNANLTAADAGTCATANACLVLRIPQNVGGATFTITTNASGNTVQFEASGDNQATWVALNVTPSNSTTAATSTTGTGTWQANVAGYTYARMRISTLAGGSTASSINPSTASARAGGGGGGGTAVFGPNYSVGGGTAQAQTVAPTVAVTNVTLVPNYQFCWLPIADNTGAAPTLAGSGTSTFSAKPITKYPGTSALVAGDISGTNGSIACAQYDGVEFQLLNPQTGWATGVVPRSQTTTSDTIAGTDRGNGIIENNGGAIAVTTTSTLGVAPLDKNFFFFLKDIGVGTATITPTGGAQIAGNNGTLGASLAVTTGQTAYCYSDNTNFQCTVVGSAAAGALVQVPATTAANTVAPTVNGVVGLTVLETTGSAADIVDFCTPTAGACGAKYVYVTSDGVLHTDGNFSLGASMTRNGQVFIASTAPTISSGFGTSPSVVNANSTGVFTVNVGTGGTASSGVVNMLTGAVNGWTCSCNDQTAAAANKPYRTVQTASTTSTLTVQNQSTGLPPVSSTTAVTSSNPTINVDQQLIELTLSANYLNISKQPYLIQGSGIYSSTAASSPALTFEILLCTISGCGSGTVQHLADITTTALNTTALTNATWNLSLTCATNTTGATGNLICHGIPGLTLDTGAALTAPDTLFADLNTAVTGNIDLTAALFIDFTIAQSVAGASNSYTQQHGAISPEGSTAGIAVPWAASDILTFTGCFAN